MSLESFWYDTAKSGPVQALAKPFETALLKPLIAWRRQRIEKRAYRAPVPVVVVGNISVGGTGKTPFLIALARLLDGAGLRVGIVSRGYGARRGLFPRSVRAESSAAEVGDEPLMLYQALNGDACESNVPVVVGPARGDAIEQLLSESSVDVILSDDGLQHYAMARDLEIVMVDGLRGLGNGCLLPFGPLREPAERLETVDFTVANSAAYGQAPIMHLKPTVVMPLSGEGGQPLSQWQGKTVHAVAGIGHPQRFFNTLRDAGLEPIEHAFPDHHIFASGELEFGDDLPVIMTEKDAVKCRQLGLDRLWYLPVTAELPKSFEQRLLARVQQLVQASHE